MSTIDEAVDLLAVLKGLPEVRPPLECFGGRIIQKMSPRFRHSVIQGGLYYHLTDHCLGRNAGRAFVELRCIFGGDSHVFDLCYFSEARIPKAENLDERGNVATSPDLAIEILSPGQTVGELSRKLRSAVRRGTRVGWLIDEQRRQVHVFRAGKRAEVLRTGDLLAAEDVMPGFSISLAEMFAW